MSANVAIVGGGLSGLHAAALLERQGIHDWVLLEARPRLGGRICSVSSAGLATADGIDRFDLGPAWFWPDLQTRLDRLVQQLGLTRFGQHEAGATLVERSPGEPALRVRGHAGVPPSMRLQGGMGALVDALQRRLDPARVVTGFHVRQLRIDGTDVAVTGTDASGGTAVWRARHVLLAVPPRLAAQAIGFEPALPPDSTRRWLATPTWMAPHAKYVAVYGTPFWREEGLSGAARSAVGPMVELHDACMPGGSAALFGFLGVPAHVRQRAGDEALRAACRSQLVRLFGARAAHPEAELLKDWAQDPLTATPADLDDPGHPEGGLPPAVFEGPWQSRVTGIASEWAPQFAGYVAGAIEAAEAGVERLAGGLSPSIARDG